MGKLFIYYNQNHSRKYWFLSFYLFMHSIHDVLCKHDISSEIITNKDLIQNDDCLMLFAPWHKEFDVYTCPYNIIFVNSESLYLQNECVSPKIINSEKVVLWIDYTYKNIKLLRELNNEKKIIYLPFIYSEFCEKHYEKYRNYEEKDIDVLFYGSVNDRRRKILDELKKKGLNVVATCQRFDHIYKYICRSKLVIVIHYYDEDYPVDYYRIAPLVSNKILFVHEDVQYEDRPPIKDKIIFSEYDKLVDVCCAYLNMTLDERHKLVDNCYTYYKNLAYIEEILPIDYIQTIID